LIALLFECALILSIKLYSDGIAYHSSCAKCADCGCQITLSNFTKSGTTLLCKTHYFKRFHEEGSYLGGDKFENKAPRDLKNAESSGAAVTDAAVIETVPSIPEPSAAPEPAAEVAVVDSSSAPEGESAAPEQVADTQDPPADAAVDTPAVITSDSSSIADEAETQPPTEEGVDGSV
jgi:hypothetical protein